MLEVLDADSVRAWALAAADALEARRAEIDELNVFPVADSDTGTNLAVTMRAGAVAAAAQLTGGAAGVLESFARGAAYAAQGSSGMIASQLLRGLADDLAGAGSCTGDALARALHRAATVAYAAVRDPREGTILSVARAAAQAAAQGDQSLAAVVTAALSGASAALARTPDQLAVLAQAGVVDAGGQGLVVMLDALVCIVTGAPTSLDGLLHSRAPAGHGGDAAREGGSDEFGYEVQYLLEAPEAAIAALETSLAGLGDTLVVVRAVADVWNVHVHVNDVGAAIEAGVIAGRPHRIRVTRFADQASAVPSVDVGGPRPPVTAPPAATVVALLSDPGLVALFATEATIAVVARDPADDHAALAALRAVGTARVLVLADGEQLGALAERVAGIARSEGIEVAVVPTRSPMQALAAIAVHDPLRRAEDNLIAMAETAAATRFAEVSVAAGPGLTTIGQCQAGDVLGLIEGDVVEIGATAPAVAISVLVRLLGVGGELLTAIIGPTAPAETEPVIRQCLAERAPLVELVVYPVEQLDCVLLLGME